MRIRVWIAHQKRWLLQVHDWNLTICWFQIYKIPDSCKVSLVKSTAKSQYLQFQCRLQEHKLSLLTINTNTIYERWNQKIRSVKAIYLQFLQTMLQCVSEAFVWVLSEPEKQSRNEIFFTVKYDTTNKTNLLKQTHRVNGGAPAWRVGRYSRRHSIRISEFNPLIQQNTAEGWWVGGEWHGVF